jgi:hypothetical protein
MANSFFPTSRPAILDKRVAYDRIERREKRFKFYRTK